MKYFFDKITSDLCLKADLGWLNLSFIFSVLFLFTSKNINAQPYQEAPKLTKPVEKIIEWSHQGNNKKVVKGGTSFFNKEGKLTKYIQKGDLNYNQYFEYDEKGRLISKKEGIDAANILTQIIYNEKSVVHETSYRGKSNREVDFFKNGKLLEEKNYSSGGELGAKYLLRERIVYSYNSWDSLEGTVHYIYPILGKDKVHERKIIYEYDKASKRRIKMTEYDYDGKIRIINTYSYKGGKIAKITQEFPKDGSKRVIEYLYQKNKLWQVVDEMAYRKSVSIYKDGRLIRTRTYMSGKVFSVVDYQYVFY